MNSSCSAPGDSRRRSRQGFNGIVEVDFVAVECELEEGCGRDSASAVAFVLARGAVAGEAVEFVGGRVGGAARSAPDSATCPVGRDLEAGGVADRLIMLAVIALPPADSCRQR
ncbi:unnamed protein product [Linum trigynum]|uniref:Uncharacterized protein n=1 Tax=Linum trigynum TaxID=586398 RepID=A0AAV2GK27_9ROSI